MYNPEQLTSPTYIAQERHHHVRNPSFPPRNLAMWPLLLRFNTVFVRTKTTWTPKHYFFLRGWGWLGPFYDRPSVYELAQRSIEQHPTGLGVLTNNKGAPKGNSLFLGVHAHTYGLSDSQRGQPATSPGLFWWMLKTKARKQREQQRS